MARYPAHFTLSISVDAILPPLAKALESCNLKMIYDTPEYAMARENPGNVPFAKLVTVEVLIDRTTATSEQVQVKLIVKNEELPLQTNNHCAVMFTNIKNAVEASSAWQVLESYTGEDV